MSVRAIQNTGLYVVKELTGEELFPFEYGTEKYISAKDLRTYIGGDAAAPNLRLEGGARSARLSDLPNAEFEMREGDLITGLQNKNNVMFSRAQVFASLIKALADAIDYDLRGYTVKTLPAGEVGMQAYVTDGDRGLVWGEKIKNSGSGSTTYKVWYNGTNWTVTGR